MAPVSKKYLQQVLRVELNQIAGWEDWTCCQKAAAVNLLKTELYLLLRLLRLKTWLKLLKKIILDFFASTSYETLNLRGKSQEVGWLKSMAIHPPDTAIRYLLMNHCWQSVEMFLYMGGVQFPWSPSPSATHLSVSQPPHLLLWTKCFCWLW